MENSNELSNDGIIEVSKASEYHLTRKQLYKYLQFKGYEKISPGIYASPDVIVDELYYLHKRCPRGVISHDEALYFHGLIDREPLNHTITIYSGYNASRLQSQYKVFFVNRKLLDLGKITVIDHFGNEIPIYNLERSIVDLVRNRSSFETQDLVSAIKAYARRPDKNLVKLAEYANLFHVKKIIRGYLEFLL